MDWKSAFLMNIKEIAGVAGRTILSCLVLWLLSVCLSIFLRSSYSLTGEEPARAEQGGSPPVRGPGVAKSSPSLWPHFPTSSAVRRRELGVNGVDYITENWETCASPATVIEYYRDRGTSRQGREGSGDNLWCGGAVRKGLCQPMAAGPGCQRGDDPPGVECG